MILLLSQMKISESNIRFTLSRTFRNTIHYLYVVCELFTLIIRSWSNELNIETKENTDYVVYFYYRDYIPTVVSII